LTAAKWKNPNRKCQEPPKPFEWGRTKTFLRNNIHRMKPGMSKKVAYKGKVKKRGKILIPGQKKDGLSSCGHEKRKSGKRFKKNTGRPERRPSRGHTLKRRATQAYCGVRKEIPGKWGLNGRKMGKKKGNQQKVVHRMTTFDWKVVTEKQGRRTEACAPPTLLITRWTVPGWLRRRLQVEEKKTMIGNAPNRFH